MPLVSISEAARLAGKERSYFHKAYVKTGKITVQRDHEDKPKVDTSELLRVFGSINLNQDDTPTETHTVDTGHTHPDLDRLLEKIKGLEALSEERLERIKDKDAQLAEKNKEIEYQRERIHSLEARYDRLLETKEEKPGIAHQPTEETQNKEKTKSFWSWLRLGS